MVHRKSSILQELVNIYPAWSDVRLEEQSVGQQFLNPIANVLEDAEKKIMRMRDNQFLPTVNLDEIDLVHRVELGTDFSFTEDTSDPLQTTYVVPTVSGYQDGTWYPVSTASNNDIETFWYESTPTRASILTTVSGANHILLAKDADEFSVTGVWTHHIPDGGRLWVECVGGTQYITNEQNRVYRGRVILTGRTRKGTDETETLVFPWDMKQPTVKEWDYLEKVEAFDIEDDVGIDIRSGDFGGGPYLDPWNFRYSPYRRKIDTFWDLGTSDVGVPTLDRVEYQTDQWEALALGFSTKEVKESWELLDSDGYVVSGLHMTIQPYSEHIWVTDTLDRLHCYPLYDTVPSNLTELKDSTPGSHVKIITDFPNVTLGEDITFTPWHARPTKRIIKYRIWYKTPSGTKYILSGGSSVAYSTDVWVYVPESQDPARRIEPEVSLTTTERGDYVVGIEVVYEDDTEHEYIQIFPVKTKTPLSTIDLTTLIPSSVDGIDFDADQRMWIKSGSDYYQLQLHKDLMLIDYDNKTIYFHENYSTVGIEP